MICPESTSFSSKIAVDIVFMSPDPLESRYGVETAIFALEATARAYHGLLVGSYAFDMLLNNQMMKHRYPMTEILTHFQDTS